MLAAIQRTRLGEYAAEVVFLFSKFGEALLEPTLRLFIYEAVCLNHYPSRDLCANLHRYPAQELVVQNSASRYMMYYKVLANFPAMLMVLCCGAWSDRAGRKLPVLLTSFGTTLAVMMYMLTDRVHGWVPFLPLVLAGAAVRGTFGRSAVVTMATHSYVSDNSDSGNRTVRLSGLLATSHFGYLLGSIASGLCLERFGFAMVFLMVIVIQTVVVLVAFACMRDERRRDSVESSGEITFPAIEASNGNEAKSDDEAKKDDGSLTDPCESVCIPKQSSAVAEGLLESSDKTFTSEFSTDCEKSRMTERWIKDSTLPPFPKPTETITSMTKEATERTHLFSAIDFENSDEEESNEEAQRGCFRKLFDSFSVCMRPTGGASRCTLLLLFFIVYIQQANKSGEMDLLLLFSKRSPLNLGKADYGYLLATIYASLGFFAFLVPRLLSCVNLSVKDTTLALFGLSFKICNLIIVSFSTSKWMLFVACAICGPQSLTISAAKSMISKLCEEVDLGKAFSIISSGETLASLVGTIVYTSIYSATLPLYPGMAFLIETSSYAVVLVLFVYLSCIRCRRLTIVSSLETGAQSVYGPIVACAGHKRKVSQYSSP